MSPDWMHIALDVASWAAIIGGGVMCIIGAIGMLRLPDVFTRMHSASLIDTGGAGLILLGLAMQEGLTLLTVKLALIFLFLMFTSPTTTHALAVAALNEGVKPAENVPPRGESSSKI